MSTYAVPTKNSVLTELVEFSQASLQIFGDMLSVQLSGRVLDGSVPQARAIRFPSLRAAGKHAQVRVDGQL